MAERTDLVPARVRVAFAHAAVQQVASSAGTDVLHIKGLAADEDLQPPGGGASNADILARPQDVVRLIAALRGTGWEQRNRFDTGSPFGHAVTLTHPHWGHADIHRFFPGMHHDPEAAFGALWADRGERSIAGFDCPVPSRPGQVLLLVLNLARNRRAAAADPRVQAVRTESGGVLWAEVDRLVDRLDARVGFDTGLGELERYRGHPDYWLWRVTTRGGTRVEEWLARVRAARGLRGKARLLMRAPLVNIDHLANVLGREPTRGEVCREFAHRWRRAVLDDLPALVRRSSRWRERP
ncbi:MAG: hypothetical protein M3424_07290 [Actinomycetota bacterium]|nr:hypothetical protein [Actinomycetota bacterium]